MTMLLDSALGSDQGRFSYIVADPVRTLRCTSAPWTVSIDGVATSDDPFAALAGELARFKTASLGPAPFIGGAVGFFSYELGGVLEKLPQPKTAPWPLDMAVGIYDTVAAFDLRRREAWVIAHDLLPSRAHAQQRADALAHILTANVSPSGISTAKWRAESTRAAQEQRIAATIAAIQRGDIYQANITQQFTADLPPSASSYDIYMALRAATPAPFAAFINAGDMHILSASPERFLQTDTAGHVETRPIKGTRPRGATPVEDKALADDLLRSAKDRAENLMIVDLLRNDLARVCALGTVSVPVLCGLETFPAVHHLVSVVTGQLRKNATALDLLQAAFPGGSITGAPKIEAMHVIHRIEPGARGPYCGAIAWLGFDGAMDSSIVIRTLVRHGGVIAAQAGGGIVAESDTAREYEESLIKLRPLLSVLGNANVA